MKKIESVLFLLLFTAGNGLFASNSDSIQQNPSLSSEKILHLKTVWSASENAAGLQFFDIQNKIGLAYLNFNRQKGDYHLFQKEQEKTQPGFFTNGYVKLNNWKFYGDFNYFYETDKGVKWVDVLEPYNDNPYTLGDARGGTYYKEYFKMRGKGAYQISNLMTFGFDIKYSAGIGARRKDPRPENEITAFDILPGVVFNLNKIKIGANFRYEGGKEDIELETVSDSIYDFYHFKGLGAFTSSIEEDDRSSESDLFGGGLQFNFNGNKISNLTEANFYRKTTDVKRGKTFPLQVVLLEKYNTSISSAFSFLSDKKTIKKLSFKYTDKRLFGHEPVVEPKLEQVSYQWSTVAKYTLYWHNEQQFEADYKYYKLTDDNHFNWGVKLSGKVLSSESTYYFVPEFNKQKLNYFSLNALIEKEIQSNTSNFIFSFESGFRKGFNNSLEIVNDDILLQSVNSDFVQHDFDYFNTALFYFGGAFQIGKSIKLYESAVQLFLTTDYKRMVSQMNENPDRNIFNVKLGVNF